MCVDHISSFLDCCWSHGYLCRSMQRLWWLLGWYKSLRRSKNGDTVSVWRLWVSKGEQCIQCIQCIPQIYIYIKAVQTVSGYGGYGTRFSGCFQTSHVESFHYWSIGLSVFLYVSRLPSCVFLIHPGTKEVVCTLHFYSRVLFCLADPWHILWLDSG